MADPVVSREDVVMALQSAWNEWTADTHCYSDCFRIEGGGHNARLYADFHKEGNFTQSITDWLNILIADEEEK